MVEKEMSMVAVDPDTDDPRKATVSLSMTVTGPSEMSDAEYVCIVASALGSAALSMAQQRRPEGGVVPLVNEMAGLLMAMMYHGPVTYESDADYRAAQARLVKMVSKALAELPAGTVRELAKASIAGAKGVAGTQH